MKKIILLLGCFVSLTGCVTAEQRSQIYGSQVAATDDVKIAAVGYIKKTFYDPYTIRDAEISNVVNLLDTGMQAVCVKMNAKNRMGAYTGLRTTSLRIQKGVVVSSASDAPGCEAPELRYEKFKELESL